MVDEEFVLERAFKIKKVKNHYSTEEKEIIDEANAIINSRNNLVRGLESYVESLLITLSNNVNDERNWQPSDFLPDFSLEKRWWVRKKWIREVKKLQKQSIGISDELMVVLIGNLVTEEALPTYQTFLNKFDSIKDLTGEQNTPFARWTKGWTAEENRHGDLLYGYSYLSGRFNMRIVHNTIQSLLINGFDAGAGEDPFKLFIYTSFQERATHISHTNTGKIARRQGDELLYKICGLIAKDEKKHETFYKKCNGKIFDLDPNGAMTSYSWMMKKQISMPAKLISDGKNPNLFEDFSATAEHTGVYTARDYSEIISHLNKEWKIGDIKTTTDEANQAQEYLLALPERYSNLADRRKKSQKIFDPKCFAWLKT